MASSSKTTTDHEEIKKWVEARGGHPAQVKGTGKGEPGILRIDFDYEEPDTRLERISWEDFFKKFDRSDLSFLYQETKEGKQSRFNKLVSRQSAEEKSVH